MAFSLLVACKAPTPPAMAPVSEICTESGNRATATHFGHGVWVTNRHVLHQNQTVWLQHRQVRAYITALGDHDLVGGDWATFRTEPPTYGPALEVNSCPPFPPVGASVWVVGYGFPGEDIAGRSNMIRATVTKPLWGMPDNVLTLRFDSEEVFPGLSGGAVIYRNEVVAVMVARVSVGAQVRQVAVRPLQP